MTPGLAWKDRVKLYGWADAARETVDSQRLPIEQADADRSLATIRTQLDEAAFPAVAFALNA